MTEDKAVTAAELDALDATLSAARYVLRDLHVQHDKCGYGEMAKAIEISAETLASLRKQLDEARCVQMTKADLRTVIELTRANAKKDAALQRYAAHHSYCEMDDGKSCVCGLTDTLASLTPAAQEAPGHTDLMVAPESIDAFLEANPLPEEAPAAPAPEDGESEADYNRRCDDLILSIKAAAPAPASLAARRHGKYAMPDGSTWDSAPASPLPGLRDFFAENANNSVLRAAVIEECAKVAEAPGFIQARDTEWDEGVNFAKRFIAAAIRALSRPVSERSVWEKENDVYDSGDMPIQEGQP